MGTPTTTEAPAAAAPAAATEQQIVPATAPAPPRAPVTFDPSNPVQLYMDSGVFGQLQRVANLMCNSGLVPAHLRGSDKLSDCFLVAAQAFRWGMDPFSVAQHTFVTKGKLGYEGKLIAALVNASAKLEHNLKPVYSGQGGKRQVVIVGRLKGETEDRTIDGNVDGWKTDNEKWGSMPDQMLFYRGAREWARRHMPEVMLGIQADEEVIQVVDMTRDGNGTLVAPRKLDQLTDQLNGTSPSAETETPAPTPAPPATPTTPTPEREPGSDDGDDKPPAKDLEKAVTPQADPNTPEGNPFLRGAEKARGKSQGRIQTE
jgi:hypothetical protein